MFSYEQMSKVFCETYQNREDHCRLYDEPRKAMGELYSQIYLVMR